MLSIAVWLRPADHNCCGAAVGDFGLVL